MSPPRIFTRNTLEAIAHLRGEHLPSSPVLGETLLAFLRSRGQLEENADPVKAREDFQNLVRHIGYDAVLPPPQANEFKPFTAMRAEIEALRVRREQELQQYKAKRESRADQAGQHQPAPQPAVARKPSDTLRRVRDMASTALKSPSQPERER